MNSHTFPDYDMEPMEPAPAVEAQLVGYALRDLSAVLEQFDSLKLRSFHFSDDRLKRIINRLFSERQAGSVEIDPAVVAAELPDVVSPAELARIEMQAGDMTPGRVESLARAVIEGWQQREIRRWTMTRGMENHPPERMAELIRSDIARIMASTPGRAADPNELPLGIVFSDELPEEYTPPEELVEGVLTVGAGSMLYGDSNSGKTYFVIDMACAVARGIPWMGRQVEQGLVVYVAAESPASVKGRLQAYQLHHRVKVPNFAIVQAPINMHGDDIDTNALIRAVKLVEQRAGMKARLVIGDTLARLAAGANENSVEDMGQIVRRMDRVRAETGAHFLVVHHSGKDAAKGARGSGSLRAAVDTEIEVAEMPTGERVAEMKKQRDLGSKGERIGFRLLPIEVGVTKWGKPATNCIVEPADAPEKEVKGRRMGEVEGAVVEFLRERKVGVRKAEVVKHFDGRYERSNVYRALRSLVAAQAAHEASGMVCIAEVAK